MGEVEDVMEGRLGNDFLKTMRLGLLIVKFNGSCGTLLYLN